MNKISHISHLFVNIPGGVAWLILPLYCLIVANNMWCYCCFIATETDIFPFVTRICGLFFDIPGMVVYILIQIS